MTTPAQYYKVQQVADLLSLSKEQVHRLISDGALGAVNVGRESKKYWRVSQDDLSAYLANARKENTYGKSA